MADFEQKIKIKETFDVSEALKGIKLIQDALKKLTLSPETKNTFEKYFTNIERQAEKASAAAASGFKNRSEVKAYTNAMDQLTDTYDRILNKINSLQERSDVTLKVNDEEFKKLGTEIDSLNKKLKELEDAQVKAANTINKISIRRGKDTGNVASWETAIKAYKDGDIAKTTAALNVLKGMMTKQINKGVDINTDKTWKAFKKDYDELRQAFGDFDAAEKEHTVVQDNLTKSEERYKEIQDATNKEIEEAGKIAQTSGKDLREYANETEKIAKNSQQLNSELENFKNKAAYFFGISNAINLFKRAVRSAYDTVKDLDAVMTETAVVTNFDVGDMWSQLPEYTQRANELGVSIHSAYEAATIFYQQGLKTNEVMAVSNETLKMARIAGLDAATASDRMTNALRGFNMEMDKMSAQRVNDVYSKLAAITASDTDEISTAMTKVASLAHNANMEFETTAAFLAQIIESTRESAETAGTALKTVVARFSEVKELYSKGELLGTDEEGEEIDVNRVSTALRSAGINLNEYLTGAKGLDDIFIELAEKWDSLDIVQQRYIATMAAGSRQQSRFIALMSDYKRTIELVEAANNAEGASQEQYGKTLESLQTKLARLKNAWDEFILGLANSDVIKGAVDILTDLITAINEVIKIVSGKNSIAKTITTFFTAFTAFRIGSHAVGKNGAFSKFLASFIGADANQLAELKAGDLAKHFSSSFAKKIADFYKGGKFEGAKERFFDSVGAKWGNVTDFFSKVDDETFKNVWDQLDESLFKDDEAKERIRNMLAEGKVSVKEFNEALEESGQTFKITEANAKDLGIEMENENSILASSADKMKIAGVAAIVLGGAMVAAGTAMENAGGDFQNMGTVVKSLGIGLMAFGTIMSVYIPLRAQLMAQKVTGAIMSIPIVGIAAAIIGLLTAIGVAWYNLAKNNSAEAKLEKAAEAAKNAAQAAEEAKDAYEKLGEAWDSLSDKYDVIEEATEGTREWKDAVKEVNDAVLELMDTYDGVKISRDEKGILHIENQDEITDAKRREVLTTEANQRLTKMQQYENVQNLNYGELGPEWQGGKIYKRAIDRLGSSIVDYAYADDDTIKELLEEDYKANNYSTTPDYAVEDFRRYAHDYFINQNKQNAESVALGSTMIDNAQIDKDLVKYANTLVSEEFVNKLIKENEDNWGNAMDGDIKQRFAEAHNATSYEDLIKNNPEFEDTGIEEMRSYLVSQDLLADSKNQIQTFVENLEKLNSNETTLFSEQEGGALTKAQAEALKAYTEEQKKIVYNELGGDAVFGENGFEEYFSKWWDESTQVALNSFDPSTFGMGVAGRLDKGLTDNLSSSTFTGYLTNLQSVFESSGAAAMNQIQKSVSDLTEGMDPKDIDAFVKRINEVNWSSVESIKSLDELAEEFGISQDEIKAFENQIIELNKAVSQFDAEKLISALGLANKIGSGEQGRSFTEEQYKTLLENGLSPDDFQLNIETGNYDYIGEDIQSVRDAILQQTAILKGELERAAASNEAIEELQKDNSPDVNSADSLRQFLNSYVDLAGENSLISRDAIGMGSLEELQNMYNKVMQEYWNAEDTQVKLNQANAYAYQTSTGLENAARANNGDEQARDILKQQLINSGMSEEEYEKLISGMNSVQTSYDYVKSVNSAGSVVDTFNEAKQYGIEAEDLNEYVEALRQVDDLQNANVATLYALALANARYQEGFKNVIESYDEWIQLKQEDGSIRPEEGNDIQEKAYTQLKKDLKEMFNLSEDISDEFLKSADNVELLEKAVNGDTEAVSKLRAEMAKTKLGVVIDDENLKNQAFDLIDDIVAEAGTLEFGATLDDAPMMQALQRVLEAAGVTVTDMAKIFESFGWAPEISEKQIPFTSFQDLKTRGYQQVVDPITHETVDIPTEGEDHYVQGGMITVPVFGGASFTPPEIPNATLPTPSSGGGGGGGSEKKPSYWENPYDELYNLQEKINEALRTREALERRYQKLLKEEKATLADIRKAYYSQINNLRAEADLQKQFAAGRLRQIQNIGEQMYTDSEGDRSSFNSWGVTKYASYDANTGLIQIDWNGLEEIANDSDREEEGKAAEAYISKLEELTSSYEEVRDKLWEIEDEIENLREAAIESYLSFEDRVLEALVNSYQQQIDSYQAMSDSLERASNEVLTSLREQVELSRQIRDNTDKEKQIADMENRLAYLQRDTSGSNALEIQKLQKDLEDARESYTDTLVDQAIEKMQNEADLAAEQRARQIETMQEQLEIMKDTGALWQQVYDLMDEAAAGNGALSPKTTLVELLKDTEAFTSLSNIGQAKWWSEVAEEFHAAWVGRDEAEDKYKTDANNDGIIANSGTSAAISSVSATADSVSPTSSTSSSSSGPSDADEAGVAMNICGPNNGWGNGETRRNRLEEKGFDYWSVQSIVNDIVNSGWDDSYYRRKYGISDLSDYSYYAFKTGGLADFTGPAWLDGTKAKPELILNAQDSANFIALKDILASLLNVQGGGLNGTKNGDNYFDIDISANIGSDYDVDRLAERLKQNIYNDGQYRNVNTINFLR